MLTLATIALPPNIPLGRGNTAVKDKPNHSPDIRRRTNVFLPPSRHVKILFLWWYYPYLPASTTYSRPSTFFVLIKTRFSLPIQFPVIFRAVNSASTVIDCLILFSLDLDDNRRTLCQRDHDRASFFPWLVRPFVLRSLNDRVYTWWVRESSTFDRDL